MEMDSFIYKPRESLDYRFVLFEDYLIFQLKKDSI